MSKSKKGAPPSPPQEEPPAPAAADSPPVEEVNPGCCEPGGWCIRICCSPCFLGAKVGYVITAGIALIAIVALVIVAIGYAVSVVDWNPEASGQSVGLVLVGILETGAACIIIWGYVAIFRKGKKQRRNLKIISGTMLAISIALAILAVLASIGPESSLDTSLVKSFQEARLGNPKARKSWSALQGSLECCGVVSAEDYRDHGNALFAPDVPISCCKNFNSDVSELAQETSRHACKQRRLYHRAGCRQPAGELLYGFSSALISLASTVFTLQVVLSILSWFISKQKSKRERSGEQAENTETSAVV